MPRSCIRFISHLWNAVPPNWLVKSSPTTISFLSLKVVMNDSLVAILVGVALIKLEPISTDISAYFSDLLWRPHEIKLITISGFFFFSESWNSDYINGSKPHSFEKLIEDWRFSFIARSDKSPGSTLIEDASRSTNFYNLLEGENMLLWSSRPILFSSIS